jgi:hypothetical protein
MRTKTFGTELGHGIRVLCQVGRDETDPSGHPHISEVSAVMFSPEECPEGFFKGQIIHLSDSLGEGIFWECDAHSQGLCDVYSFLLMEGKPLYDTIFGQVGDLFHLERLWIAPKHRGKNMGLACCAALLALFQNDCGYAAMKPFPLQWEGRADENKSQFLADRQKLVSYYRPLGFICAPQPDELQDEFYYRPLDGFTKILGYGRSGWRRVNKVRLPAMPEDWPF